MIKERSHSRSVVVARPVDNLGLLTERERAVLQEVCLYGMTGAAPRLGRSYQTLKNQMTSVYAKLGIAGVGRYRGGIKMNYACYLLGRDDERQGIAR